MPKRPDADLVLAAGRGDRDAFGEVVERHHRAVIQYVHRFLGTIGRDTAEDLAQDVFLRAWKASPSFEPRANVLTWLLRIAANLCLNYQRSSRLRRFISLDRSRGAEVAGPQAGPADTSETQEKAASVRRAVAQLPPNQRAAIVLRYFHDLAYAEIAEVLKTSVSAVESLLFRARRTLRGRLTDPKNPAASPQVLPELGVESHGQRQAIRDAM